MRLETIQALKHGNFRLFWIGSLFSFSGQWVQLMALSWLVLELTDSPFYLGMLGLVRGVPAFAFSLLGGIMADRVNRRRLFFITHIGALSLTLLLAFLVNAGVANVWVVLAITFIWSTAFATNNIARQTLVPQLVERPDLINAVGLVATARSSGRIIGPLLAGVIITRWNIAACLYTNAVLMTPMILSLLFMRVTSQPRPTRPGNISKELGEALRYVIRNRAVTWLLICVAVVTFFGMAYTVMLPVFARDLLGVGASGYGYLVSASAVGALLASLGAANLGRFRHKGLLVLWIAIIFGWLIIALALSNWYQLSMILVFFIGAANIGFLTLVNSLIQLLVPDELRGRVLSLYMLGPASLHHMGTLFLGTLAAATGIVPSLVTVGLIVVLSVTAMAIWITQLRRL